jgi:predicted nucleotidyltransferase
MLLNNQIQVFEEFLRDFRSELTGSFIAKKRGINQKNVSNYLNWLEKETILKSKTEGKNKLYFFNLDNKETVKNFIIAAEHIRTVNFYKSNVLVKEISEKIQNLVSGTAVVFGSYAKGLQKKDSDLDILVIGKCNEKEISKISKIYKVDISLKIYPGLENDILTREAVKDHIIIKNAEQFIEGILNG